jgi:hypothetical protein
VKFIPVLTVDVHCVEKDFSIKEFGARNFEKERIAALPNVI